MRLKPIRVAFGSGSPSIAELSRSFGISRKQVKAYISAGALTWLELQDAFLLDTLQMLHETAKSFKFAMIVIRASRDCEYLYPTCHLVHEP